MLKNYGVELNYCDSLNNLIIISCGESQKLDGLNKEIVVVSKINYPYNDLELEETLLRSLELCHSKEPNLENKQKIIEKELGIKGYGKATKNLKLIQLYWTKDNGYQVEPYERIPRRGYVIIEEQIITLDKKIVQGQLAEAVRKSIGMAKLRYTPSFTTMKINFCNSGKKAILKRTQLIHFLKKGRVPNSWIYGLESDWIKML